eukprot:2207011-Pleurochrysis_carterae.AAC.1
MQQQLGPVPVALANQAAEGHMHGEHAVHRTGRDSALQSMVVHLPMSPELSGTIGDVERLTV